MSDGTVWKDSWGDWRFGWVGAFVALIAVLGLVVIIGIGCVVTYAVSGCFVNKGHMGPHISDGCYEYHITKMTFPRFDDSPTFYLRGEINGKVYTIRADSSLGEQAWSAGEGGIITVWSKNNHIIKYHIGGKGRED